MPKPPRLIPTADAAKMVGRDVRTVHRAVESGRLVPVAKLPGLRGAMLFDPEDVEKAFSEKEKAS